MSRRTIGIVLLRTAGTVSADSRRVAASAIRIPNLVEAIIAGAFRATPPRGGRRRGYRRLVSRTMVKDLGTLFVVSSSEHLTRRASKRRLTNQHFRNGAVDHGGRNRWSDTVSRTLTLGNDPLVQVQGLTGMSHDCDVNLEEFVRITDNNKLEVINGSQGGHAVVDIESSIIGHVPGGNRHCNGYNETESHKGQETVIHTGPATSCGEVDHRDGDSKGGKVDVEFTEGKQQEDAESGP